MPKVCIIILEDPSAFNQMVYPPLGLLYIGTAVEDIADVFIHDLRLDNHLDRIPEADFFLFSVVSFQYYKACAISLFLKNRDDNCFTIIGGPHVSFVHSKFMLRYWDAVVIGDGELEIRDIIFKRWIGIFYGRPSIKWNKPLRRIMPVESIRNKELWQGYGYDEGPYATTIITSRGCPFNCSFCANIPCGISFNSTKNITDEIIEIHDKYDVNHFRFLDDHFTMNKKRLRELVPILKSLDVHYRCSSRSDSFDQETAELLIHSGCEEVGFGIESADQHVLDLMNKHETVEQHEKAINIAHRVGLKTKVFFMAGLPGETIKSIYMNIDFIERMKPTKSFVTMFMPYPGSDVYNNPWKYNVKILNRDYSALIQTNPTKSIISCGKITNYDYDDHFSEMLEFLGKI